MTERGVDRDDSIIMSREDYGQTGSSAPTVLGLFEYKMQEKAPVWVTGADLVHLVLLGVIHLILGRQ